MTRLLHIPPTDDECEVILEWLQKYGSEDNMEPWETEFVRDNYFKDEFTQEEQWECHGLVMRHLEPMPESLVKWLEEELR